MRLRTVSRAAATLAVGLAVASRVLGEDRPGTGDPRPALRVAVAARIGEPGSLSPLVYWGGFETKTAVFEPLAGVAADGSPSPALATSWEASPDGRVWTFTLREGVVAHDGTALDAAAVRDHLLRWRGNPSHRWLGATDRMERVEALDGRRVRVTLSDPWYLLPDLATVNPAHVVAPGAWAARGDLRASVGTGPFRVESQVPGERIVLVAHDRWWGGRPACGRLELVALPTRDRESDDVLRTLLRGEVDLVQDGETPRILREQLDEVRDATRWKVWSAPGTNVTYLAFNLRRPPFDDAEVRRLAAAALRRDEFVAHGELGHAVPATSLFRAPGTGWPAEGGARPPSIGRLAPPRPVTLLLPPAPSARWRRHADLAAAHLAAAGLGVRVEVASDPADHAARRAAGDFDLSFGTTQGLPYDPYVSARSMFGGDPSASPSAPFAADPLWRDETMARHVRAALTAPDDAARRAALAAAQARLDEAVPLVPLFVCDRLAVSRADVDGVSIGANGYDFGLARLAPRR